MAKCRRMHIEGWPMEELLRDRNAIDDVTSKRARVPREQTQFSNSLLNEVMENELAKPDFKT
jgi:hypothetical protein